MTFIVTFRWFLQRWMHVWWRCNYPTIVGHWCVALGSRCLSKNPTRMYHNLPISDQLCNPVHLTCPLWRTKTRPTWQCQVGVIHHAMAKKHTKRHKTWARCTTSTMSWKLERRIIVHSLSHFTKTTQRPKHHIGQTCERIRRLARKQAGRSALVTTSRAPR